MAGPMGPPPDPPAAGAAELLLLLLRGGGATERLLSSAAASASLCTPLAFTIENLGVLDAGATLAAVAEAASRGSNVRCWSCGSWFFSAMCVLRREQA